MAKTGIKRITFVVGARPNIIKVDPLIRAANAQGLDWRFVHTGQHYDYELSQGLFDVLGTPEPHLYPLEHLRGEGLDLKDFTRGERFGLIAAYFGQYCNTECPDLVVVVGDVDSTVACAMAAKMSGVRVAHVEAGCRSGEKSPEEQNRIITDDISDYLYCRNEVDAKRVDGIVVGDPAIDTLQRILKTMPNECTPKLKGHILLTLHRPENVDTLRFKEIISVIRKLSMQYRIIFPVHPRTVKNLKKKMFGFGPFNQRSSRFWIGKDIGILATPSLDYLHMIRLMRGAVLVITDSGGMQLDTSYLGVPCITVRKETEHKDTLAFGTNFLAYTGSAIFNTAMEILGDKYNRPWGEPNPLWDGQAAVRIINHVREIL